MFFLMMVAELIQFGLRLTSPSGTISEVYIEPIWDFSYNVTGSWSEEWNYAFGNCFTE